MAEGPAQKRRRTSPDSDHASSRGAQGVKVDDFVQSAARWDLEQDYEQRPRKNKEGKASTRLPVKNADGLLEPSRLLDASEDEVESEPGTLDDASIKSASEAAGKTLGNAPDVPLKQQMIEAKEELAKMAASLNENPEENSGLFRVMCQYAESKHVKIKTLALAAQAAVYKDQIPGYRIRPISEEDSKIKVSKEIRQQRSFEQALVKGYQGYLRELAQLAKKGKGDVSSDDRALSSVAISCACALLLAVPHFNFRGELLGILVNILSSQSNNHDFIKCRETLEELFRDDEDGKPSLEAVTLLTKMMKARHYKVDESVLNTFLHLRLLSELSFKASQDRVDGEKNGKLSKKLKGKREYLSKKQRKLERERKVVEKEMRQADASVSHEERDRMQADTLKLVFVTYFRILKEQPPGLMGAVLEGLAKYAHLINQDFFGDLLEVLKDLIGREERSMEEEIDEDDDEISNDDNRNSNRESLLCIVTAFALLQGQDTRSAVKTLNLDLSFFITHLYRLLHSLSQDPDIERNSRSLHLPDPHSPAPAPTATKNKINIQTTTVLLLRCLSSVLLPTNSIRSVPPLRIAALTKQIMSMSLQVPEKSCLALLGLLRQVTKTHGRKIAGLWRTEEKKGDGVFDATSAHAEGSNPFASTVWEGELLRCHYCPKVREAVKLVENGLLEA